MTLGVVFQAFSKPMTFESRFNRPNCIEKVWAWTVPTEKEKKFDRDNDPDLYGYRFSCFADIGATEINEIFNVVKDAVAKNDKEKLAHHIIYPFTYWVNVDERTEYGNVSPRIAYSKIDFINHYDEIVTADFKEILDCSDISKFEARDRGSVTLADDFISFSKQPDYNNDRYFEKYPMRISEIGPLEERHKNWITEQCQ